MQQPMSDERWHELKMLQAEFSVPWDDKARDEIAAEVDRLRAWVKELECERKGLIGSLKGTLDGFEKALQHGQRVTAGHVLDQVEEILEEIT